MTRAVNTALAGSGGVLQVVQTVLTTEFSWTTKGSWTDITGLDATITPVSTSSRVLIQVMLSTGDGGNNYMRGYRVVRNGNVFVEGYAGTGTRAQFGTPLGALANDSAMTVPMIYVDSPSSTSAQTYKLQGFAPSASVTTSYINRAYTPNSNTYTYISSIILMEIAG